MKIYAGTEIPKNFSSKVTLIDPERSVNRDVLIYMNHPLRYRGETFYQAGFQKDDSATILQVVHNPSFIAPYVACVIVAAGLLGAIRLPSRRVFATTTERNRHETVFALDHFSHCRCIGWMRLAAAENRQRTNSISHSSAKFRCSSAAGLSRSTRLGAIRS